MSILRAPIAIAKGSIASCHLPIHQLVMHLCTNAVHAMTEGGTLTVSLERADIDERRSLSPGSLSAGRYVRLAVDDTGCGMDAQTRQRPHLPVILMGGYVRSLLEQEAAAAGIHRILTKPLKPLALSEAIAEAPIGLAGLGNQSKKLRMASQPSSNAKSHTVCGSLRVRSALQK